MVQGVQVPFRSKYPTLQTHKLGEVPVSKVLKAVLLSQDRQLVWSQVKQYPLVIVQTRQYWLLWY